MNALLWWFLHRHLHPQQFAIPVHYNIYYGIDLLGPWWYPYALPAAGLAVFLVNALFSAILYAQQRLASYLLLLCGFVIQCLAFLAAYLIITQI